VHEGEQAVLSVIAAGPESLSYQWQKNGADISGATNSTYTIQQAAITNRGDYAVIVSAGSLSISSPTVTLTVVGLTIFNGGFELGNFSGWITNDVPQAPIPLGVRRNGVRFSDYPSLRTRPVEGTFSASFGLFPFPGVVRMAQDVAITPTAPLLTFDYLAWWEGVSSGGTVPPRVFKVTIEPSGGGAALFSTNILSAPVEISRTNGSPVRVNPVDLTQFVGQDVRISFDAEIPGYYGPGLFQLDNVGLHALNDLPVITVRPTDLQVHEGGPAVLSVGALGPEPLSYQWLKNGVNISGATNSTYTIAQAALTDRGDY